MSTYTDEQLADLWADSPHLIQIWCDNGREQVTALPIRLDLKWFRDLRLALVHRKRIGWTVTEMRTGLAIGSSCGVGTKRPLHAVEFARRRLAKVGRPAYDGIVATKPAINDDLPAAEIVL